MPADKESIGVQLIGLIGKAKQTDLDQLDKIIAEKKKEIAALENARKTLAISLGVEQPRQYGTRKPKAKGAATNGQPPTARESDSPKSPVEASSAARRQKIAVHLLRNGSTAPSTLCRLFDIPSGSITSVLDCEWFSRNAAGSVELTPVGREAAMKINQGKS